MYALPLTMERFPLGRVLATPGALEALANAKLLHTVLLARHVTGDWGDLGEEDKRANEKALQDGSRIFSRYHLPTKQRIWVITEADRSATTLLLPNEY